MEQKIIQIGNSTGLIIPKLLLKKLKLQTGSEVLIEPDPDRGTLVIVKKGEKRKLFNISPHFLEILEKVNTDYGDSLRKLADI